MIERRLPLRRPADVSAKRLRLLNAGRVETCHLMEWLAADTAALLGNVLADLGLGRESGILIKEAKDLRSLGVTKRLQWVGERLHQWLTKRADREQLFEAMATHNSDLVRQWPAYVIAADRAVALADRLARTRRFAADMNMSVRECAWMSFRPYLIEDPLPGIHLLKEWVRDPDPNIRRFAIEVTRPRSVWGAHIPELKRRPELSLPLLAAVRADTSRYVRHAVGNWLNDASKTQPNWVRRVCDQWAAISPLRSTQTIIRRALRTLDGKARKG